MTFAKNRSCGGFLVSEYTAFVAQVLERRCCFSSKVAWQGRDQCRLLRGLSGIRIRASGEVYSAGVSAAYCGGGDDKRNDETFHWYSPFS
jgi:hypothetical protein